MTRIPKDCPQCEACNDTGVAVGERIGPTGDVEQYEGACPNGCSDGFDWANTPIPMPDGGWD